MRKITSKKYIIGIIGGTGKFGQWFRRFFENEGYKVLIASRSTSLTPKDCAKRSDIVIVCVPMNAAVDVIKSIGPCVKENALLMDFTSLKKEPVEAMLSYSKAAVIGAHPVFGPSVSSLKNHTIVLCPGRPKQWLPWLKNILLRNGAKIKIATPEQHDRMMSIIQGMMHFASLSVTHTIKELKIDVKEAEEFSSPLYRLQMDMVGRILNQDPELYADIELMNPFVAESLRIYKKNVETLLDIINRKDYKGFVQFFQEAADHLGDFRQEAEEYSDYIIEQLVKRKKR